jgi:RNA polymerase sigma-70 factor (ECF subfamily)
MEDGRLVAAVLRGQQSQFGVLVERYQRALVCSARLLTHNVDDAEDLAQETLVDAYRNLNTLREPRKFRAWLFGILRHKCQRHLERRRPEEFHLEDWQETLTAPASMSGDELLPLLESLPLADREVLVARYLHELSVADIATLFAISVPAAEGRCRRARARLRTLVNAQDEERTCKLLASLLAFPISHGFSNRVLREVSIMASTTTKSTAAGAGILACLYGWKGAVTLGAVLVIGAGIATPMIAHHEHEIALARGKSVALHNKQTVDPVTLGKQQTQEALKQDLQYILLYAQENISNRQKQRELIVMNSDGSQNHQLVQSALILDDPSLAE